MGQVCEHQIFGLDPIFEPILTPTFEFRLDLSQLSESVFVPLKPKSVIPQTHTSVLDKGVEQNDSRKLFLKIKNWMGIIF